MVKGLLKVDKEIRIKKHLASRPRLIMRFLQLVVYLTPISLLSKVSDGDILSKRLLVLSFLTSQSKIFISGQPKSSFLTRLRVRFGGVKKRLKTNERESCAASPDTLEFSSLRYGYLSITFQLGGDLPLVSACEKQSRCDAMRR